MLCTVLAISGFTQDDLLISFNRFRAGDGESATQGINLTGNSVVIQEIADDGYTDAERDGTGSQRGMGLNSDVLVYPPHPCDGKDTETDSGRLSGKV